MTLLETKLLSNLDTDKGPELLAHYEDIFAEMPLDQRLNLLELGVHTGGSLRLWNAYWDRIRVVGVDINTQHLNLVGLQGILVITASQDDKDALTQATKEYAPEGWHIIIDDASHISELTSRSFAILWPHLRHGGWYCIEDWGTGYWPQWSDGKRYDTGHCTGMVGFVKNLVDRAAARDIQVGLGLPLFTDDIAKLVIANGFCAVKKK